MEQSSQVPVNLSKAREEAAGRDPRNEIMRIVAEIMQDLNGKILADPFAQRWIYSIGAGLTNNPALPHAKAIVIVLDRFNTLDGEYIAQRGDSDKPGYLDIVVTPRPRKY